MLPLLLAACLAPAGVSQDTPESLSPLEIAAEAVREDDVGALAAVLDEEGILSTAPDTTGGTLLHLAAALGSRDCTRALIDAGAAIDARDVLGETPLHVAAQEGDPAILDTLTRAWWDREGDPPLPRDARGWTPLHHAAALGHPGLLLDLVYLYPGRGVRDDVTGLGQTALHLAARGRHFSSVSKLLDLHCHTDPLDDFCLSAVDHAREANLAVTSRLGAGVGEGGVLDRIPDRVRERLQAPGELPPRLFADVTFDNPFVGPKGLVFAIWDDGLCLHALRPEHRELHVCRIGIVDPARVRRLVDEVVDCGFLVLAPQDWTMLFSHFRARIGLRRDDGSWSIHGGAQPGSGTENRERESREYRRYRVLLDQVWPLLGNVAGDLPRVRHAAVVDEVPKRRLGPASSMRRNHFEDEIRRSR